MTKSLIFLCFYLFALSASAQNPQWRHFPILRDVVQIEGTGGKMYLRSDSYISVVDTTGQILEILTPFTSGLPFGHITDVEMDPSGNPWIAVGNNVAHFDGTSWTIYNSTNSPFISSVVDIEFGPTGNLWVASDDGLSKYDGTSWTYTDTASFQINNFNFFRKIQIDSLDRVWIGSFGGGLTLYDGTTWTTWHSGNSPLPHDQASPITIAADGTIWVQCVGDYFEFDGIANWIPHTHPGDLPCPGFRGFTPDHLGNLWFGDDENLLTAACDTYDLAWYDGNTWYTESLSHKFSCLYADENNTIWGGRYGPDSLRCLLKRNNPGVSKFFTLHLPLLDGTPMCASDNTIYIGQMLFDSAHAWHTIMGGSITSNSNDHQGGIWETHSYEDDNNNFIYMLRHYHGDALTEEYTLNYADKVEGVEDGSVWYKSATGWVNKKGTNLIVLDNTNSPIDSVTFHNAFALDSNHIWFGSSMGIFEFNPYSGNTWTHYADAGLGNVQAITLDSLQRITAICNDNLVVYDGTNWTVETSMLPYPDHELIFKIGVYENNEYYFPATYRTWKWNGATMTPVIMNGLDVPASYVTMDAVENLLLSGNKGLFAYNPEGVVIGMDDEPETDELLPLVLFPNPANNIIHLQGQIPPAENIQIQLIDLHGRILSEEKIDFSGNEFLDWQKDISALSDGLYFIVLNGNNFNCTAKFLKND